MNSHEPRMTRRLGLTWGGRLLMGAAVSAAIGSPQITMAAKADKRDFFYQDRPKGGKSCAGCRLFSSAEGGKGQCAIVDGEVSPNGWCMAYSAKA